MLEEAATRLSEISVELRKAVDHPKTPKSVREAVLEQVEELEQVIEEIRSEEESTEPDEEDFM
jgi:type VI protein secretion system component VasF